MVKHLLALLLLLPVNMAVVKDKQPFGIRYSEYYNDYFADQYTIVIENTKRARRVHVSPEDYNKILIGDIFKYERYDGYYEQHRHWLWNLFGDE